MRMRRGATWAAVVALVSAQMMIGVGPAAAACEKATKTINGKTVSYCVVVTTPGGTQSGGGSGGDSGPPPCTLDAEYKDLCLGEDACWMNDPAKVQKPSELEGVPKPDEDSYVVYIKCQRPDGSTYDRWYWNDDAPTITLEDRILAAAGALDLPTFEASFNPETRTLVNLPTWWWAEGAPDGEIRGTEALGMVAVAVPRGLSIDPGDGSGALACPMSVSKSDACSTDYRRAGDYTAAVSIVYDISFVFNGEELPATDIPAELRTVTVDDDVPVAVREVQSRVTDLG